MCSYYSAKQVTQGKMLQFTSNMCCECLCQPKIHFYLNMIHEKGFYIFYLPLHLQYSVFIERGEVGRNFLESAQPCTPDRLRISFSSHLSAVTTSVADDGF